MLALVNEGFPVPLVCSNCRSVRTLVYGNDLAVCRTMG